MIAEFRCLFKVKAVGGSLHFPVQPGLQLLMFAFKKHDGLVHQGPVFLRGDLALAGGKAAADIVIQTGPLFTPDIVAGTQGKELVCQFQSIVDDAGIGIGTEVSGLVSPRLADHLQAGIVGGQIYAYIGIFLVVFEEDIVARPVLLDKLALQQQSFHLSGSEDVIQIHRQPLDCLNFELLGSGLAKIGAHPAAQVLSLAHVDYLPGCVFEDIDTAAGRQLPYFFR